MRDMTPAGGSPDRRWIERTAGGDPLAIAALYERYSGDLYGLALRITGSPADAWDVVHDTFAGLPEALRAYEERGRFRPWLFKLTTRVALMKLRRRRNRREVSWKAGGRGRASLNTEGLVDRILLDRAVEGLTPRLRAVFLLRAEGFSHVEIGEALGISEGASRVRLCRAHKELRRLIDT